MIGYDDINTLCLGIMYGFVFTHACITGQQNVDFFFEKGFQVIELDTVRFEIAVGDMINHITIQ